MGVSSWNTEANNDPSKETVGEYGGGMQEHGKHDRAGGKTPRKKKAMPAPDGPESWFIAIVGFFITLGFSSVVRVSSLLFTATMDTFQVSRGEASLPISIFGGFYNIAGLVAAPLIHSFGVRWVAVGGGLMLSFGLIVSFYANGITFLIFSVGVVAGTGQGILLNCVIVSINQYFDKRRGFALGINLVGATMASFVFPKLMEIVIDEYQLQGTCLLLGALLLNCAALSLLLHEPPWETRAKLAALKSPQAGTGTGASTGGTVSIVCNPDDEKDKIYVEIEHPNLGRRGTTVSIFELPYSRKGSVASGADREHRSRRGTVVSHNENSRSVSRRGTLSSTAEHDVSLAAVETSPCPSRHNEARARRGTMISVAGSLVRDAALGGDTILGVSEIQPVRRGTIISMGNKCQIELPPITEETLKIPIMTIQAAPHRSALDSAKEVLLFPRFYVHVLSYFASCFFIDGLLTVVVDYAVDVGLNISEAVFVLTFFSAADIVGRLCMPLLSDYGVISKIGLLSLAYAGVGSLGVALPFVHGKLQYWLVGGALGCPLGYIIVGTSETLANEVGLKNLPMAFGMLSGISAIGAFGRPVIIGFFRDTFGSYDGLFWMMGGSTLFCGFLLSGLWVIDRNKKSDYEFDSECTVIANKNACVDKKDQDS